MVGGLCFATLLATQPTGGLDAATEGITLAPPIVTLFGSHVQGYRESLYPRSSSTNLQLDQAFGIYSLRWIPPKKSSAVDGVIAELIAGLVAFTGIRPSPDLYP